MAPRHEHPPPGSRTVAAIDSTSRRALTAASCGHSSFMFHRPGVEDWATEFVTDADPELTPPAGYAYVLFSTEAILPAHPLLDYGEKSACIDHATQEYYQPIAVGTHAFTVYSGEGASGCNGSVIASAPPITVADGEVWLLHAIGDEANGIELRPVKLTRN
jgi:hypothetical protein